MFIISTLTFLKSKSLSSNVIEGQTKVIIISYSNLHHKKLIMVCYEWLKSKKLSPIFLLFKHINITLWEGKISLDIEIHA